MIMLRVNTKMYSRMKNQYNPGFRFEYKVPHFLEYFDSSPLESGYRASGPSRLAVLTIRIVTMMKVSMIMMNSAAPNAIRSRLEHGATN